MNHAEHRVKPDPPLIYFVGIDVPLHIKEEIYLFTRDKMRSFGCVDLIRPEEYHITLAYLGKITPEQRIRLIRASDEIKFPPFSVSVQGIGFYPRGSDPKIVWLGIGSGREQMKLFGDRIRTMVESVGLPPRDSFFPHITIGNLRNIDKADLQDFVADNWSYPFGGFKVESFHLYRITKNGYDYNHEVKLRSFSRLVKET